MSRTPSRPVPRWYSAPLAVVGAPDAYVDAMTIDEAEQRSELPSGVPTPGREAWLKQRYSDGDEDEESSTDEEEEEVVKDDKGEDPDHVEGGPRKRAAANGAGPQKPRAANGDGRPRPCRMNDVERAAHKQAVAEKKAMRRAEGADELKAAVAALKAHDLYKKTNYQTILAEVEDWAERGGTVLTAAKWIRCLVSEGKDRLTPSQVRTKYKAAWPGPGAA